MICWICMSGLLYKLTAPPSYLIGIVPLGSLNETPLFYTKNKNDGLQNILCSNHELCS
nr:MAG TPA: hypothetical protein [Crassvirales sp.]